MAEIAYFAVRYSPVDLGDEGKVSDGEPVDRMELTGRVFHHTYTSAYEDAAYILWALEVADPVMAEAGTWRPALLDQLRVFPPYFQLSCGIAEMLAPSRWDATRAFPSLDYVLSVYVALFEERLFPAAELRRLSRESPMPELDTALRQHLRDHYPGEQGSILAALSGSALVQLLEDAGYVIRCDGEPVWTSQAAKALRGLPDELQPAGVRIVDGRPRLLA